MTLPIQPDVETVLESCAKTVREILVPELQSEWARYSGDLCAASLEYALRLLQENRNRARRDQLAAAVDGLRPEIAEAGGAIWRETLLADSPFVAASALLVAAQNDPGPLADHVRAILHPLLDAQLDADLASAMPLFAAFARNMVGR